MVRTMKSQHDREAASAGERQVLTLKAAADLLNVDPRYLTELLDAGQLASSGKAARRHVRRDDILAYKEKRDAARRAALAELTAISEDAGLYDADYRSLLDERA